MAVTSTIHTDTNTLRYTALHHTTPHNPNPYALPAFFYHADKPRSNQDERLFLLIKNVTQPELEKTNSLLIPTEIEHDADGFALAPKKARMTALWLLLVPILLAFCRSGSSTTSRRCTVATKKGAEACRHLRSSSAPTHSPSLLPGRHAMVTTVPSRPSRASTALEREVMIALRPGKVRANLMAAITLGSMLPGAKCPSSM